MPPKKGSSQKGTKRNSKATGSDADMNSVNPKRSRRLSERATQGQQTRTGRRGEPDNITRGQDKKKSFEAIEQREVEDKDGGTVHKPGGQLVEGAEDLPYHPRRSEDSLIVPSLRSEPSTVTLNPIATFRDAHEATAEEITKTHPSMMHVNVGEVESGHVEQSLPQEGVGAIEDDEYSPRPAPSRPDVGECTRRLEALQESSKKSSPIKPFLDRSDIGGNLTPSSADENPRRSLSDNEESPRTEGASSLENKISSLEKDMQSMYRNLSDKLDKVLNELEQAKKEEVKSDLKDIIHSLCYHLENNVSSPSYIENKILPLKMILNEGIHRKCVTKFIVDSLVMALETTPSITPKCLNNIAEVMRIVLYSKSVGGKKDVSPEDEEELHQALMEMKKKMTFIIVNTIQNNPRLGTQAVSVDGNTKRIEKPSWMQPGFTSTKHIVQFFSRTTRRKKVAEKSGDRDAMCETIIRTINDHHGKAFAKIRDRIRVDTMKEVFFIFENFDIDLVKTRDITGGPIDLRKIPLVNIARVPPAKVRKVVKKIWDGTVDIVGEKLTYVFEYNVEVQMKSGEVERKKLVRKMNFLYGAALILMRITGNGTFFDLLTYHEKIIRVIIAIAEMLVALTEMEFIAKKHLDAKREDCPVGDDDYHILNVITCIHPTQIETRQEMVRECILKITEDVYDKLHYCSEDEENDVDESEEDDIEEGIIGEDDEDESIFANELNGAMQFLSKA